MVRRAWALSARTGGDSALVWNLGSLLVLAWPGMPAGARDLVIALSFSVLSLLPAVLLHLSLKDGQPALVAVGYLLGGVAVGMHFWEVLAMAPRCTGMRFC